MTKVYLKSENFSYDFKQESTYEEAGTICLGEFKNVDFHDIIEIRNEIYHICIGTPDKCGGYSKVVVEKIDLEEEEDANDTYEINWTCPVCGYEDQDSFELEEEDNEYECPNCRAITSYSRNIEVTFAVKLIKYPKVKKLVK